MRAPLYRRIEALRSSRAYHRLWRRGVRHEAPAPAPGPPVGTVSARHVDEALDYLRSIPFQELQRRGWHLQPNHYYWPLNDIAFLREHPELWHGRGLPAGIDWDLDGQVAFARDLAASYGELADVAERPAAVDMSSEITFDQRLVQRRRRLRLLRRRAQAPAAPGGRDRRRLVDRSSSPTRWRATSAPRR